MHFQLHVRMFIIVILRSWVCDELGSSSCSRKGKAKPKKLLASVKQFRFVLVGDTGLKHLGLWKVNIYMLSTGA